MFNGIQKYETEWRHGMDNMHVWQVQHIAPHVEDKWVECYFSLLQLPELSTGQGEQQWHVARSPTSSRLWGQVKAIFCNYYRENITPLVIYSETWRMCQCIATLDISVSWHDKDLVAVLRSWRPWMRGTQKCFHLCELIHSVYPETKIRVEWNLG